MKLFSTLALACLAPSTVLALVGFDTVMYKPPCAFACRSAIGSNMLSCSSDEDAAGGHMHDMSGMTTPECRASDTAFLTTLAWCLSTKCADDHVPTWKLEKYWQDEATGDPAVMAKWTYSEALLNITEPPERELDSEETLNYTAIAPQTEWQTQYRTNILFEHMEALHERYGVILLVVGFGTPVVLTWLGYLPYMTGILERVKPYITYPTVVGTYQVRPLPYLLGNAPTLGQSIYIGLFVGLTVILSAVGFASTQPHGWGYNKYQEITAYVMYRTGVLSFAIAPLVFLFSGRNNILLWLSNWSHSTYLLLHRWIARVFAILALLHSILALRLYINLGTFSDDQKQPYWIWGSVATVAISIMLIASGLYVRRWSYEIFLITHIVLAVLVVVGCWYHIILHFGTQWGYEMWLYAVCAVWFFERAARVLRIAKNGIRRAKVVDVSEDFVRVDVDGIRWGNAPGQHVYAYFPTLNPLKPWENHPFSVLPTALLRSFSQTDSTAASSQHEDVEKHESAHVRTRATLEHSTTAGMTLYIRKSTGMTKYLKAHDSLLTLLDGPYPNNPTKSVLRCDRLLLVGGGIGITGLLPWISQHSNVKLCWSVKESAECLVQDLNTVLSRLVDKEIRVGRRLDINELLKYELESGWEKIGVVACGPGGLCDDVRTTVAAAGRAGKAVFELEVDAYSW